ncbi:MAG: hypothetical protein MI723_13025 [Caulobacterales bacterium]|nr:hypothetical protein [Caulobacterales bacterium]
MASPARKYDEPERARGRGPFGPAIRKRGPIAVGFMDIGLSPSSILAHVGDGGERFVDEARDVLGEHALVHVFEPRGHAARRLTRRASRDSRLIVHSCSLGRREEEAHISGEAHAVRPLDMLGIAPEVLSITAPGREADIIAGSARVLERTNAALLICGLFPDVDVAALTPRGYEAYALSNGALRPRTDPLDHAWLLTEPPAPPFDI